MSITTALLNKLSAGAQTMAGKHIVIGLLLVLAGIVLPVRTAHVSTTARAIEWAACDFSDIAAEIQAAVAERDIDCGYLIVPESRDRPGSNRMLRIAFAIVRAASATPAADPVVYLDGGPGVATLHASISLAADPYFMAIHARRDIIFFDQRGAGKSDQQFCPELAAKLREITLNASSASRIIQDFSQVFAACRERLDRAGVDLAAYNSEAVADDVEDLRLALEYDAWNLYGVSYGTRFGLEVLRRHPESVRAAVLDGVFPPNSRYRREYFSGQLRALRMLDERCRLMPDCAARIPDMGAAIRTAVAHYDANPIVWKDGGRITGLTVARTILSATYFTPDLLAMVVEPMASGDDYSTATFVEFFLGPGLVDRFSLGLNYAINCIETGMAEDSEAVTRIAAELDSYLGLSGENSSLPALDREVCSVWQPALPDSNVFAPVASDVPTLLFAMELDPLTPPDDAHLAAVTLSRSLVIDVPGAGHAASLADLCLSKIAADFIDNPLKAPSRACLDVRPDFKFQF